MVGGENAAGVLRANWPWRLPPPGFGRLSPALLLILIATPPALALGAVCALTGSLYFALIGAAAAAAGVAVLRYRVGLCLVLLGIPFLDQYTGVALIVLVILGRLLSREPLPHFSRAMKVPLVCFAAFVCWQAVAAASLDPGLQSLREVGKGLLGLVAFGLVLTIPSDRRWSAQVVMTLAASTIVLLVLAISVGLQSTSVFRLDSVDAMLLRSSNYLAAFMGPVALLLYAARRAQATSVYYWTCVLGASAAIAGVILSGSRGMWVIFGLLFCVLLVREKRYYTVALVVLVTFLVLPVLYEAVLPAKYAATLAGQDPRLIIWATSLDIVRANPWMGSGPGAFESAYGALAQGQALQDVTHSHNLFIYLAAESGLPALILFVSGLGIAVAAIFTSARRNPGSAMALGWATAVVAYAAFCVVDVPYYNSKLATLLFLLLGFGLRQADVSKRAPLARDLR